MGRFLPVIVFAVLVGFLGIGLTLDPREVPSPLVDKAVPEFSLTRLREPQATFSDADLRGEVSLVNVWASWCASCRVEHPLLMELARTHNIPIYGLNYKDAEADAKRWLADFGDPFTAIGFDNDGRVGIDWGVYGAPETFVIDKRGYIRYKHIGPLTDESLRDTVLPLVERLKSERT